MAFTIFQSTHAIIGFDCSPPMSNYFRISTLEVGKCNIEPKIENITLEDIYLIQRNDMLPVHYLPMQTVCNTNNKLLVYA